MSFFTLLSLFAAIFHSLIVMLAMIKKTLYYPCKDICFGLLFAVLQKIQNHKHYIVKYKS